MTFICWTRQKVMSVDIAPDRNTQCSPKILKPVLVITVSTLRCTYQHSCLKQVLVQLLETAEITLKIATGSWWWWWCFQSWCRQDSAAAVPSRVNLRITANIRCTYGRCQFASRLFGTQRGILTLKLDVFFSFLYPITCSGRVRCLLHAVAIFFLAKIRYAYHRGRNTSACKIYEPFFFSILSEVDGRIVLSRLNV